ncbi:hypothetical protein [Streptomyces sp. NBC_00388]|uniref:hypothetical protein n=1 Tax=Streptomyces sp. NBC_00388 TaxID=2975735 RepID=UPI002E1C69EE
MTARGVVTAVTLLGWWAFLFLLYTVLITSVSQLELAVGAGAAALGAVAAEGLRRAEQPRGGVRGLLAAGASLPAALLRECAQLLGVVVRVLAGRPVPGTTATFRLEPGVSPGWAAVLLAASPGSCVVDISKAGSPGTGAELTVHLLGSAVPGVERALPGRRCA